MGAAIKVALVQGKGEIQFFFLSVKGERSKIPHKWRWRLTKEEIIADWKKLYQQDHFNHLTLYDLEHPFREDKIRTGV